jgi:hypothetical protein
MANANAKAKATPVTREAKSNAANRPSRRQTVEDAAATIDENRLLREAAWSQMFGRIEAKNPFTRLA